MCLFYRFTENRREKKKKRNRRRENEGERKDRRVEREAFAAFRSKALPSPPRPKSICEKAAWLGKAPRAGQHVEWKPEEREPQRLGEAFLGPPRTLREMPRMEECPWARTPTCRQELLSQQPWGAQERLRCPLSADSAAPECPPAKRPSSPAPQHRPRGLPGGLWSLNTEKKEVVPGSCSAAHPTFT